MKKFSICFLTFLVFSLELFGQEKSLLHAEKKLALINNLYQYGSYSEAINEATILSKELTSQKQLPAHYGIQTKIILLKSLYSILEFEKAKEVLSKIVVEIDSLSSPQEKALSALSLVSYYNEIGSYQAASIAYGKCSLLQDTSDSKLRLDYEIARIIFLTGQKYLVDVKKALLVADSLVIKLRPEGFASDSMLLKQKPSSAIEYYFLKKAIVQNLKLTYLLSNGNYVTLEKELFVAKRNTAKELGENHREYSKAVEIEADLNWVRQRYKKAFQLYKEAYSSLAISDYEQHKIYLLSRVATTAIFLGDVTLYDQYMRRIQMHADRNIHKYNYYQLIHGYSDAYAYYAKGEYATATNKFNKIIKKYPLLPENHFFRRVSYSFALSLYAEDAQLFSYRTTLDTLLGLAKVYLGEKCPAYHSALLDLASAVVRSGEDFKAAEVELSSFNDVFSSSIDSVSVEALNYYGVLSELYFQTDRFVLAKKNSDIVKSIALQLYGLNSWEYSLIYMKNIEYSAWAGNYKEAVIHYAELEVIDKNMQQLDNSYQYIRFHHSSLTGKLLGDFNKTKTYSLKALKLLEFEHKNQRLVFSDVREQAAVTYIEMSNLYTAEKILL